MANAEAASIPRKQPRFTLDIMVTSVGKGFPSVMPSSAPQLSFCEALQIRAVRRLWFAQIISVFGDFLAVFAVFSVVTFELHGTPVQVSMILVAFLTPFAFVSPLAFM